MNKFEHQKPLKYLAPFEVVIHNSPNDCWLSFLGKVVDVTSIVKQYENEKCIKPVLAFAGKDVSHWFDARTGELQHYIHPITGVKVPYCPYGRLPDVPPAIDVPSTQWKPLKRIPWWKDDCLQVGLLTKRVRPIRIINMLIGKQVTINVCCEDTFHRIQERYAMFNKKSDRYVWRYFDADIDLNKTMEENGIPDERDHFVDLDLPQNYYIPSVFIYYDDDDSEID